MPYTHPLPPPRYVTAALPRGAPSGLAEHEEPPGPVTASADSSVGPSAL